MPNCGCHYWANQFGAGYVMCGDHSATFLAIAKAQNLEPEVLFNRVVLEYAERIVAEASTRAHERKGLL